MSGIWDKEQKHNRILYNIIVQRTILSISSKTGLFFSSTLLLVFSEKVILLYLVFGHHLSSRNVKSSPNPPTKLVWCVTIRRILPGSRKRSSLSCYKRLSRFWEQDFTAYFSGCLTYHAGSRKVGLMWNYYLSNYIAYSSITLYSR